MEVKIQKQIIDLFSFFEEFYNSSNSGLKDCQKCAISINKLIKRFKNIKDANIVGTPLEDFGGIRNKLCVKIHNLILEEVREVESHLAAIEDSFEKLCNKHKSFTENCKEINFKEQTALVKGTPLQPPLQQLLEFADKTIRFGSQICAQVKSTLSVLSFKGINTVIPIENFKISSDWQRSIQEIISYTSFCAENQI